MAGFTCPYCGMIMSINGETHSTQNPSFESSSGVAYVSGQIKYKTSALAIDFYRCPNCGEHTIFASGKGTSIKDVNVIVRPRSMAKQFPNYIPTQIKEDYEEACSILFLSPKASATLSRRCLQGMIHDYWGITKSRLIDEISALQDKIQPDLWKAIDGLRQLGNIGAHMEKDVDLIIDIDPGEAEKLIKLIELLIKEWYINREERKNLFGDILQINAEKQVERKGEV